MDIGSAFTYMFDDEDWIMKIVIGGVASLLAIIIVPIFLINGYMLQTIKNVRDGQLKPLPEWEDFGNLIVKGLVVFVIGLVYNIPAILLSCGSALAGAAPEFAQLDSDAANAIAIASGCLSCVQIIFTLLAAAILPAGLIRYAEYDTLGSAFQFGEIFSFIKDNIGDYIIVVLLSWVAGFVAIFGLILCFIGIFFTAFWSVLVVANLYGQLARKAASPVQEPI